MVWAPLLDLYIGAVRRVLSTLISDFPVGTHKLEVEPKPWESTIKTGNIPAGKTGVS
jgi:hypothetical protein